MSALKATATLLTAENVTVTIKAISVAPTSARVDRNDLCPADGNIVLSYAGGTLGDGATAEWYSDAAFTTNVGNGNSLTLATPGATTTYYVRFEGDCNTTSAVSVTENIKIAPVAPASANADRTEVCEGVGDMILSYTGGNPGTGGVANWYSDAAFTTGIGTGNNLSIPAPTITTDYYVRFEAECGNSAAKTVTVIVNLNPQPLVNGPDEVCLPGSAVFTTTANANYNYTWNITGGVASGSTISDQLIVDYALAASASVNVTVTDTITGCAGTSAVHNIEIYDQPEIFEIQSNNKLTEDEINKPKHNLFK